MNKSFLTLAAVSVLALAACGEDANDNTTTEMMSSVEETTTETYNAAENAAEDTYNAAENTAEEISAEAEADYQAAVDEFQDDDINTIEPATGTTTTTTTTTETEAETRQMD